MIRDRGKIKWQPAHFMPEHGKMLYNLRYDDNKQMKPLLDEQKYEEIGIIVMDSLNHTIPIKVTTWQDGFFQVITGIVDKVDRLMKNIQLESDDGIRKILIDDITAVERM